MVRSLCKFYELFCDSSILSNLNLLQLDLVFCFYNIPPSSPLEHMARVKDRLIFENKKIEAVQQRKSNREQKLRSKEAQANKVLLDVYL